MTTTQVALQDYLSDLAQAGSCLTTDVDHWAAYGVYSVDQLLDYLEAEHQRNMRKDQMARIYLDSERHVKLSLIDTWRARQKFIVGYV